MHSYALLHYALLSARSSKRRLGGTTAAIMLGVALIAATFVATDTISHKVDEATAGPSHVVDLIVVDQRSPLTGSAEDDIAWIPDLLEAGRLTPLPTQLIDDLGSVEGVASATGVVMAPVDLIGPGGQVVTGQGTPIARSIDDSFSELVDSGRLPAQPNEVVLDRSTAASEQLAVGDPVTVVLPDGQVQEFTLVGTVSDAGLVGNLLVGFDPATAASLLGARGDPREYSLVELEASPGVDADQLSSAVRANLGPDHGTITGAALRDWRRAEATQFTDLLRRVITVAGIVALLLGSFVIRNTFTIVLASRARELAVLRCIGSTRRQIRRLVLAEAAVIGVVASAAGIALGVALAAMLGLLVDAGDILVVQVTGAAPVVTARTVFTAVIVGTMTAVVSALGAARRATRTSPIAALRDEVHGVARREGRVRTVVGLVLIVAGGASITAARALDVGPGPQLIGTFVVGIGIVAAGPILARASAIVIGATLSKLFGITGDLARANAMRNPKRTSAMILPVAIGLALIVAFTVFANSIKAPIADDVNTVWKADLRVTPITANQSQFRVDSVSAADNQLSPDIADRLDGIDELATVVALSTSADYAVVGHELTSVTGVDAGTLPEVMELTVVAGSLDEIQNGAIAISTEAADQYSATIGTALDIDTPNGREQVTVSAIYRRPTFSPAGTSFDLIERVPYGHLLVSPADYRRTTSRTGIDTVLATTSDSSTTTGARQAANQALGDYPAVEITTRVDLIGQIMSPLNGAFRFYYGLLGLMTVVAFLGVANTLALSIAERRREIGLLRAVGLDRRQTMTVIRLEATVIAITAVAIAIILGSLLGQVFTLAQELPSTLPTDQIALIAIGAIGIVIGLVHLPARRASRLPTLTAITSES